MRRTSTTTKCSRFAAPCATKVPIAYHFVTPAVPEVDADAQVDAPREEDCQYAERANSPTVELNAVYEEAVQLAGTNPSKVPRLRHIVDLVRLERFLRKKR